MTVPSLNQTVQPSRTAPHRGGAGRRRWLIIAIALLIVGGGVVIYPFIPAIRFALLKPAPVLPYETKLAQASLDAFPELPKLENKPIPEDNRLVIPSIGIDMSILEGATEKVLDRGGIWHIPNTSDPIRGGNIVLSGHRWQYLPPSSTTLYLLDKVEDGQPVIIYWEGQEYDYTIVGREIVNPDQVRILENTPEPKLTIFTCTPLWSTKQRLVLYGELIS